jgi:hypothetical protein
VTLVPGFNRLSMDTSFCSPTLTNDPWPSFTGLFTTTPSLNGSLSAALIWWGQSSGLSRPAGGEHYARFFAQKSNRVKIGGLGLGRHRGSLPAYCKSGCFGKNDFLRYWGHSRYCKIRPSRTLGSDFLPAPRNVASMLAALWHVSLNTITSSTLKTTKARAI